MALFVATLGLPANLWTKGTVCIVSPLREVFAGNVICVTVSITVTLSRNVLSSDKCMSESKSSTSSVKSRSVMFSPYSHCAKCTSV